MTDYQALKVTAKKGCVDSLNKLDSSDDEVLRIFLHHLDPRNIPNPTRPTSSTIHSMEVANASLKGISNYLQRDPDTSSNGDSVSYIKTQWHSIWKWTHFLLVHCFSSPMLSTITVKLRHSVYWTAMCLLRDLADDHNYRDVVGSTPEVIKIITKLWVAETKKGCEALGFMASTVLERFVSAPKPGWLDQVVAAAGNDPVAVSLVIIERLRANFLEPTLGHPNISALHKDLLIAIGFSSEATSAICYALWSKHSVTMVTKVMLRLSSEGSTPDALINQCLAFCAIYLSMSFLDSEDAPTWVVQAIDAQMIPALLKSVRFFPHGDALQSICSDILGCILPQYSVYRSVLRAIARSFKKIKRLGLEAQIAETGSFQDAWETLKELVNERLLIQAHYDADPTTHAICDNPQCLKFDESDEFMRCSGCLSSYFCSKDCQKLAWKGNHRTMCKSIQARRQKGVPEPISKRDMDFICRLNVYDRWKHQDRIQEMKLRQLILQPSANRFSLFTSFDYTKVPVSITVGPPEAHRPDDYDTDENHRAEFDSNIKRAGESEGRFTLFTSRVSRGPVPIILWSARPEEGLIRTPVSSSESTATTLHETLGMTEAEFTKLQPRILEFLDSQLAGKNVEVNAVTKR